MNLEQFKKLLTLRIDATGEYLLIEPEAIGELIIELLETGEDRPDASVADKLDKYIAREKLYEEWYSLGLKLQERKLI
jgi:hypothetical protein